MDFSYKGSGVDIDKANSLVDFYKECGKKTKRPGVLGSIGGFGGLFQLNMEGIKNPVLVSSTDGVGTKLELAIKYNKHQVVGQDLVAMCVNDIITCGAQPLFFLDYLATGKLDEEAIKDLLIGITNACVEVEATILGGETAEMPGFYPQGKYDVAGFTVGVVDKDKIIDGSRCQEGDVVIGLPSSGIHSNGYSLVRKLMEHFPELTDMIDDILEPTNLYWQPVKKILSSNIKVSSMSHITGGGIIENIPRVIPEDLDCVIKRDSWEVPKVFKEMQRLGNIEETEMFKTFNMGIGYVIIIPENELASINSLLTAEGIGHRVIGSLQKGSNRVRLV